LDGLTLKWPEKYQYDENCPKPRREAVSNVRNIGRTVRIACQTMPYLQNLTLNMLKPRTVYAIFNYDVFSEVCELGKSLTSSIDLTKALKTLCLRMKIQELNMSTVLDQKLRTLHRNVTYNVEAIRFDDRTSDIRYILESSLWLLAYDKSPNERASTFAMQAPDDMVYIPKRLNYAHITCDEHGQVCDPLHNPYLIYRHESPPPSFGERNSVVAHRSVTEWNNDCSPVFSGWVISQQLEKDCNFREVIRYVEEDAYSSTDDEEDSDYGERSGGR
jgi:hypothetical protein